MSRIYFFLKIYALILGLILLAVIAFTQEVRHLAVDKPQAIADLITKEGAATVNAKWYVQPAHIHDKEFYLPGPQRGGGDAMPLYPTGKSVQTQILHPQVGSDDFEKGFIRAEVISYNDFVKYNGEHGAKEAGKWRLEGKEYIVQDGDILNIRHSS